MMELLAAVESSRGIPMALLFEALEEALTAAAKVEFADAQALVSIDRTTGATDVFTRRVVVEHVTDPATEITAPGPGYLPGDFIDMPLNARNFSRLAALTAREMISRRVVEFERDRVFAKYRALEGTLVHGLVQRNDGGNVYALLDRESEAVLPRSHYDGPTPAINEWVYVVIDSVRKTKRGPAITLSRASENFIAALLPGWAIVAIARDPGTRTMVAVALEDPIEAPDLAALPAAENELGEPITWCAWNPDPAAFVAAAITALGGDVPFVIAEPGAAIVAPTDVDTELVSRLTGVRVIATDDIAAARSELENERLVAQAMEFQVPEERDVETVLTDEQMAALIRFRDEREAAGGA